MAANATVKQRGKPFRKGVSGNPAGKKPGTKHRVTMLAQSLIDDEAETIIRKLINLAKKGDRLALRLVIERLVPVRRERVLSLELPKVESAENLPKLTASLLESVGNGELTPGEGAALASLISAHGKNLELCELARRVVALEEKE